VAQQTTELVARKGLEVIHMATTRFYLGLQEELEEGGKVSGGGGGGRKSKAKAKGRGGRGGKSKAKAKKRKAKAKTKKKAARRR
jgi:hypothetical protein